MPLDLTQQQCRILGCLMEKAVVTPDQYPLTLNALVSACNQKSSRDPVMNMEAGEVMQTVNVLKDVSLVVEDENFRSRTQKFSQRLCGTPFSDYAFDPAQYAIVCLLLLRGPQTPGELRSRSGRLYTFADNEAVKEALASLIDYGKGPIVARLARPAGRQDHVYAHTLAGAQASVTEEAPSLTAPASERSKSALQDRVDDLETRVAALEAVIADLTS